MIMKLVRDQKNWDTILGKFSKDGISDSYHNFEYQNLYKSKDSEPILFVHEKKNKLFMLPFLKNKILDTNYYDFETAYGYGGPLTSSFDVNFIKESWGKFKEILNNEKIIAGIIRFNPILNSDEIFKNKFIKIIYKCSTVVMECNKTLDHARGNYSKDIKNRLKKINKDNIKVSISNESNYLNSFKKIYIDRMIKLKADQSYFFTQNYFDNFINFNKRNWKILSVIFENKFIGGAILLFSKNICNVHLSSSLEKHFNLSPNIIIRDKVIEYCYSNRINYIHFGGGRTHLKDDSLLSFKMKFCKNLKTYFLGGMIINEEIYNKFIKEKSKEVPEKYKNYFLRYRY